MCRVSPFGSRCYLACVVNVSMLICSSEAARPRSLSLMNFAARGLSDVASRDVGTWNYTQYFK